MLAYWFITRARIAPAVERPIPGTFQLLLGARHFACVIFFNNFRSTMQVARSGVVAQPCPVMQDVVYGRISQLAQSREALHKTQVIVDHRRCWVCCSMISLTQTR